MLANWFRRTVFLPWMGSLWKVGFNVHMKFSLSVTSFANDA